MVLNYIWNWNLSEVDILVLKVCPNSLYALEVISIFEYEICTVGYIPWLNWKWRAYIRICIFFNGFQLYVRLEPRSSHIEGKSFFD